MAQSTKLTQLDQANLTLKAMSVNITPKDRSAAEKKLSLSRFTILMYLKGEGLSLDTATSLIIFFRKCIDERAKHISPSL